MSKERLLADHRAAQLRGKAARLEFEYYHVGRRRQNQGKRALGTAETVVLRPREKR